MRFLIVKSKMLSIEDKFDFPIFLFDPLRDQRVLALHPSSPVTDDLIQQWEFIESKEGHLQIATEDEEDFLKIANTTKEEIHKCNEFQFRMFELWQSRMEQYSEIVEETFLFTEELHSAVEKDDFMPIIQRARAELLLFPITISNNVSMMTQLAERVLVQDNLITRSLSFTYFFAKKYGIKDQEALANLMIAALCKDMGLVLINLDYLKDTEQLLENDNYLKHPMLTIYILSKLSIEFNKTIKRIILEQHEQVDGSGFPRGKKESHISILSQIAQLGDYLFRSSMEQVDGKKKDLFTIIKKVYKQDGLDSAIPRLSNSITDILRALL